MALFMFVNTKLFFSENTTEWNHQILLYLVMLSFVMAFPDLRSKLFNTNAKKGLFKIFGFAVLTYLIMNSLGGVIISSNYYLNLISIPVAVLLMQSFVVAVTEETLFREYLGKRLGAVISSLLFAVFHFVAYSGDVFKTLIAFVMGLALYYVHRRTGLEGAIGVHAGWNAFVYMSSRLIGGI